MKHKIVLIAFNPQFADLHRFRAEAFVNAAQNLKAFEFLHATSPQFEERIGFERRVKIHRAGRYEYEDANCPSEV